LVASPHSYCSSPSGSTAFRPAIPARSFAVAPCMQSVPFPAPLLYAGSFGAQAIVTRGRDYGIRGRRRRGSDREAHARRARSRAPRPGRSTFLPGPTPGLETASGRCPCARCARAVPELSPRGRPRLARHVAFTGRTVADSSPGSSEPERRSGDSNAHALFARGRSRSTSQDGNRSREDDDRANRLDRTKLIGRETIPGAGENHTQTPDPPASAPAPGRSPISKSLSAG